MTTREEVQNDANSSYPLGHTESVDRDFAYACGRIGLPRLSLNRLNVSERKDYRVYYDEESRARVEEYFRRDIELFGYGFD